MGAAIVLLKHGAFHSVGEMAGALFVLAAVAVFFLSPDHIDRLAFDRFAILNGEWWRLWSAHLAHYSRMHLIADAGTLFFLGLVIGRFTRWWHMLAALLIGMPMITALLVLLVPGVEHFRGASALVAMLWMAVSWYLIFESRGFSVWFIFGYLLLAALAIKIAAEYFGLMPPSPDLPRGLAPPWQAHIFGSLVGLMLFNALYQIHTRKGLRRIEKPKAAKAKPLPRKLKDYEVPATERRGEGQ